MSNKRRVGRFKVSGTVHVDPEAYKAIFTDMVVLKADYDPCSDTVEYFAYHEGFAPVERGHEVPMYNVFYEDGKVTPEWLKQ